MTCNRWSRLFNWGPLMSLTLIFYISSSAVYCHQIWWRLVEISSISHLVVFLFFVSLILWNFFRASLIGPGFLPLRWKPLKEIDKKYLQFCELCQGYKAPRSHHCRCCNRCILKMDHHCPWIGTCVGFKNQANFILFLLFVIFGCVHSSIITGIMLFQTFAWQSNAKHGLKECLQMKLDYPEKKLYIYESDDTGMICNLYPYLNVNYNEMIYIITGFMLGAVVAFLITLFSMGEIKAILENKSDIENWIIEKALYRRELAFLRSQKKQKKYNIYPFVFPYDMGYMNNFLQVFGWSFYDHCDGTDWPVIDSRYRFSLTVEQKEQKADKKAKALLHEVVKEYSGECCVKESGIMYTCLCCSQQETLPLKVGESIYVTRSDKKWMYGWRPSKESRSEEKGWFPRNCLNVLGKEKSD